MGFDLASITAAGVGATLNGIGSLATSIREAIVGKEMTPDLQVELQKKAMDLELAVSNAQMVMIKSEADSQDKWTSRARPAFMYVFYFILVTLMMSAFAGIWWPDKMDQLYTNIEKAFDAIPEALWWTFTTGYLGYTGARTIEKRAGVTK